MRNPQPNRVKFLARFAFLLIFGVLLAACAPSAPQAVRERFFWPPQAESARIEYVDFYAGDADLNKDRTRWVEKYILGELPSQSVFKKPFAIDARFGKVVVTDTIARRVILFRLAEKTIAALGLEAEPGSMGVAIPTGVAFAGPEEIWIADSSSRQVKRINLAGQPLGNIGLGRLTRPTAVAVDYVNQRAVVIDPGMHRLAVFGLDGTFYGYFGERGKEPGQFNYPFDADFDAQGNLFVLDAMNSRVQRFRWEDGAYRYVSHFGERGLTVGSLQIPKSLAVSPSGHIYVTDSLADKVVVFDQDGTFLLHFGGRYIAKDGKVVPGGFNMPAGIAIDENDGIWIADSLNAMVHRFQYLNAAYLQQNPITSTETRGLP